MLEQMCLLFPSAPICTLLFSEGSVSPIIASHTIRQTILGRLPWRERVFRYLLPLFPALIEGLRVPDCDLVLSTSHCVAKGVMPPRGAKHLCYCFTPMRYAWALKSVYVGSGLKGALAEPALAYLRAWDRNSASRVDRFVAISRYVADRVKRFYGRDADVVYPPTDTDWWTLGDERDGGFDLVVAALVPYKRVDLAVAVANRLRRRLVVVGTGPERARLEAMAGESVQFIGWRSDEEIRSLYRSCRLLLFPGIEDFGLVPVEAQACGCPVVAYNDGGARETVVDGVSGMFFTEQNVDCLAEALSCCDRISFDRAAARRSALRFGVGQFVAGIWESVCQCLMSGRPEGC